MRLSGFPLTLRLQPSFFGPAGQERYRELQEVVDRHCPVLDLTSNPTSIVTTLASTSQGA